METKEDICQNIINEVQGFLDKEGNHRSIAYLSYKTGVSYNTIKRLAQNETKTLEQDNAFAMLSYFCGPQKAASLMKKPYPRWYQTYGGYHEQSESARIETDNEFHWTPTVVALFDQCCSPNGCSIDWIIENLGRKFGVPAKDLLLSRGMIKENPVGSYISCSQNVFDSNWSSLIKQIESDSINFPVEEVGSQAFIGRNVQALSNEAAEKWIELTKKYYSDTKQIKINDDKSGSKKEKLFRLNLFGYWTTPDGDKND